MGWRSEEARRHRLVELTPTRVAEAKKDQPAVIVSIDAANATATRLRRGVITVVPTTSTRSAVERAACRAWRFCAGCGAGQRREATVYRVDELGQFRYRVRCAARSSRSPTLAFASGCGAGRKTGPAGPGRRAGANGWPTSKRTLWRFPSPRRHGRSDETGSARRDDVGPRTTGARCGASSPVSSLRAYWHGPPPAALHGVEE